MRRGSREVWLAVLPSSETIWDTAWDSESIIGSARPGTAQESLVLSDQYPTSEITLTVRDMWGHQQREGQTDYNRPLQPGHAQKFMQYVDVVENPYTPPIALSTDPANIELEAIENLPQSIGNVRFVTARFERSARDQVEILDGQHRIYGAHLLSNRYQEQLTAARDHFR